MNASIRHAEDHDAPAIAALHAGNWRTHYRGILPDQYLDEEVVPERDAYWRSALPRGDYPITLLATAAGRPVGFVALKFGVDEGYDATVEHLHVSIEMKGQGLGRQLMRAAAACLKEQGMGSVCLWVFEDNAPAIGFYESLGGTTDAHGTDKFAGGDAPDRRIGWRDLDALITACSREDAS